jgi:hypothetical protein
MIRLHFHATNNVVEYEALINGLCIAAEHGVQWLYIHSDSDLILNQAMGESNCHDPRMAVYRQDVRRLQGKFDGFELHHILRHDNEAADALARLGSSRKPPPPSVFVHDLFKPSIWLEEDDPAPAPGISSGEDSLTPTPGAPPGKNGAALPSEAEPMGQGWEPRGEIVIIVGLPGPNANRWRPILKYL